MYHYQRPLLPSNAAERQAIIDEIVAKEKAWHSTDVTFKRGWLWSASGTPAENEMLEQRSLSGTGSGSLSTNMDRERAFLVRWPAGKDIKGRPVYLRKYYHTCGAFLGISLSASVLQQVLAFTSTERSTVANAVNGIKVVGAVADTWTICAANGRNVEGDAQCHAYLEHHQLGDQWR